VRGDDVDDVILDALSLVIASVPVALPMVMQITMAIGARKMADHKAIVTHLTALQEIASMTVLCSDKTGTLTTAHITVMPDQIWCNPAAGYSKVGGTYIRGVGPPCGCQGVSVQVSGYVDVACVRSPPKPLAGAHSP
jgi:magnesium-transporting ATPase (P-type)